MARRTIVLVLLCTIINSLCMLSTPSAIATPVDDFFNIMQELESIIGTKGEQLHKSRKPISTLSEGNSAYIQPHHRTIWSEPRTKGKLVDTGRCSIP